MRFQTPKTPTVQTSAVSVLLYSRRAVQYCTRVLYCSTLLLVSTTKLTFKTVGEETAAVYTPAMGSSLSLVPQSWRKGTPAAFAQSEADTTPVTTSTSTSPDTPSTSKAWNSRCVSTHIIAGAMSRSLMALIILLRLPQSAAKHPG